MFAKLSTLINPIVSFFWSLGDTPCKGINGGAPPERGARFSGFKYMKGYSGLSKVELYERVGKSVISACEMNQRGEQMHFVAAKKSREHCLSVVIHILKTV